MIALRHKTSNSWKNIFFKKKEIVNSYKSS